MKLYHLMGLLLLGVLWCKANEEDLQDLTKIADDDDNSLQAAVKELFEKKCHKQVAGVVAFQNLTEAVGAVKLCLSDYLPNLGEDELKNLTDSGSSEEICTDKRGKIRECFNDFIEAWKYCSEPEEQYLPDFVFDALEAVYDYVCADDGSFILKVVSSLDCIEALTEKENSTEVCSDKFKFLQDDTPEDITLTKDELCEDLAMAKSCYGDYVEQECPGSQLKDVVAGLYSAISSPCDKRHKRNLLLGLMFN